MSCGCDLHIRRTGSACGLFAEAFALRVSDVDFETSSDDGEGERSELSQERQPVQEGERVVSRQRVGMYRWSPRTCVSEFCRWGVVQASCEPWIQIKEARKVPVCGLRFRHVRLSLVSWGVQLLYSPTTSDFRACLVKWQYCTYFEGDQSLSY